MKSTSVINMTTLIAGLALCASSYFASPLMGAERGDKRGGPPPEAIEACNNNAQGAVCSFQGRRGDVEGMCITLPKNQEQLVCKPEGHPPEGEPGKKRPQND